MTTVLLVEDEVEIQNLVKDHLEYEGFNVICANDGVDAINKFHKDNFDIILLDMMLPKINGKEVLKAIRQESKVPVIIVSAKDSEVDKVFGLELGADDYLTKPYSLNELVARINSTLRRISYYSEIKPIEITSLKYEDLVLDLENYILTKGTTPITLTSKEFEIIKMLLENPKKVFTKAQIFSNVWNDDFYKDDNTVMVHIRRLREKIEEDPSDPKYIKTVWGIGYKLGDI
ncbi:DNA-binding response regulator, OmpR family, contains REC and winged-helix (wHTH) domain [Clostridium cavendishii DSM 21758]|uniref:Stage 0 sporulation protein A homolog n=1 Tax=Clostridium cavendishii DSM 21758 TaxID=1121302 RepID=A0A1M6SVC8_9CLOT|nr:response regulator transcription factor [Clostridium cavendishii]SHK48681.1 DNA-binding response regulator, OmpR family, contains REC and winged-helix (wHTH) domain [Clostridium cavendishii DSM 21758]